MLAELDSIVTRARMFQHKPDGQVATLMMEDGQGAPIPSMQDPMHYPHGTKFLAPGTSPPQLLCGACWCPAYRPAIGSRHTCRPICAVADRRLPDALKQCTMQAAAWSYSKRQDDDRQAGLL